MEIQRVHIIAVVVLLIALIGFGIYWLASRPGSSGIVLPEDFLALGPQIESMPRQAISDEEREGLVYLREEERLARDVLLSLYQKWQLELFAQVSQSEQTHTDTVRLLLEKYSIEEPAPVGTASSFENPDLGRLYTESVSAGQASVEAALTVAAFIEEVSITHIDARLQDTDNDDIKLAYENMMRGSRNHLRLFVSQLNTRGITYKPIRMSEKEFNEIITSRPEARSGGGLAL